MVDVDKNFLLTLFKDLRSGKLTSGLPEVRENYLKSVAGLLGVDVTDNDEVARAKAFPTRTRRKKEKKVDDEPEGVPFEGS